VKLGKASMLQVSLTRLSALPRVRGQWTDAGRSAHSLSVDWQAWGTKGGLCWRATRDGLRHVPAGPPKSRAPKKPLPPLRIDPRKLRLSAHRATISVEYVPQGIQAKTARETATSIQRVLETFHVSCAHVPKGILCNPSNQRKQQLALTSPTWARGLMRRRARAANGLGRRIRGFPFQIESPFDEIRVSRPPHWVLRPEKQNSCFSLKPCQVVPHARARVGKIRFFDHPYNPRKREQSRTSGGKAVELAVPNVLRNARRSAPGLPVGLAAMGHMLGRLSKRCVLASTIRVQGKKRMGTIHRLSPVLSVTESRARARRSQMRRFAVRCQLLDGW
jgi:hypothetical protein